MDVVGWPVCTGTPTRGSTASRCILRASLLIAVPRNRPFQDRPTLFWFKEFIDHLDPHLLLGPLFTLVDLGFTGSCSVGGRQALCVFGCCGLAGVTVKVIDATTLHSDPRPTRRLRHSDITPGDPRPSHWRVGCSKLRLSIETSLSDRVDQLQRTGTDAHAVCSGLQARQAANHDQGDRIFYICESRSCPLPRASRMPRSDPC